MAAGKTYGLKAIMSCVDRVSPVLDKTKKNLKTLDRAFANVGRTSGAVLRKLAAPLTIGAGVNLFSIREAVSSFLSLGDSIDKAATRAGVATGALQKLRYAAQMGGMRSEQMDKALSKLSYQMGRAAAGENKGLVTLFSQLGISWRDSSGKAKDAATVMRDVAEAVKVNAEPAKRLQILTSIFGDDLASSLVPVLKDGAEGLDRMASEAEKLGIVMSGEDIQAASKLGDRMSIFRQVLQSVGAQIAGRLAPVLTALLDHLQDLVVKNKDLIALHLENFVKAVSKAVDDIPWGLLADGFTLTIKSVAAVIEFLGGFKTVLLAVGAVLGAQLVTSCAAAAASLRSLGLAFYAATGPVGLVIAAVAGAAYLIWSHWDWLKEKVKEIGEKIGEFLAAPIEWVSKKWDDLVSSIRSKIEMIKGLFPQLSFPSVTPDPDAVQGNPTFGASPSGAPGRMTGEMVVRVEAANGAKATVTNMEARGMALDAQYTYTPGDA